MRSLRIVGACILFLALGVAILKVQATMAQGEQSTCRAYSAAENVAVNLRSGPGDHDAALNAFAGEQHVAVLERTDNGWLRVQMIVFGTPFVGFVPAESVRLEGDCSALPVIAVGSFIVPTAVQALPAGVEADAVQPPTDRCTVAAPTGSEAVLYDQPTATSRPVGVLQPGPFLNVFATDGQGWLEVWMLNGGLAWVHSADVVQHGTCESLPLPTVTHVAGQTRVDQFIPSPGAPSTMVAPERLAAEVTLTPLPAVNVLPEVTPTFVPTPTWISTATPVGLTPTLSSDSYSASRKPVLCAVISVSGVDVALRTGPGEAYPPYSVLRAGEVFLGVTRSDNGWLEVHTTDRSGRPAGWAAPYAVGAEGPCDRLPVIAHSEYDVARWYPSAG